MRNKYLYINMRNYITIRNLNRDQEIYLENYNTEIKKQSSDAPLKVHINGLLLSCISLRFSARTRGWGARVPHERV